MTSKTDIPTLNEVLWDPNHQYNVSDVTITSNSIANQTSYYNSSNVDGGMWTNVFSLPGDWSDKSFKEKVDYMVENDIMTESDVIEYKLSMLGMEDVTTDN